jgi:hypothetical protein
MGLVDLLTTGSDLATNQPTCAPTIHRAHHGLAVSHGLQSIFRGVQSCSYVDLFCSQTDIVLSDYYRPTCDNFNHFNGKPDAA